MASHELLWFCFMNPEGPQGWGHFALFADALASHKHKSTAIGYR